MATKLAPSVEDILALPDDGYRHEIVFGAHHVSPAPSSRHQRAVVELVFRLSASCPPALAVLVAPFAWVVVDPSDARHEVQPDLLVIASGPDRDRLEGEVPALVVEVLSPGAANRARDLEDKFALYEAAGVPAYWVLDPEAPSLRAWRLAQGKLALVAEVRHGEVFGTDWPWAMTLGPDELVGPASW
ncbi:MAG: Uma2 family endonuclease [Acidimicrobiales bacterium]